MAKKRVSLTIEEDLVGKLDSQAEHEELNRSQTAEKILEKHFKNKAIDTAVILCGDQELKAMKNYEGKPVLSYVIQNISDNGISEAIMLTGNNRRDIESHFGEEYCGVDLNYVEEEPKGTASALKKLESRLNRTFIALNGHVITDVDVDEMLSVHREEETVCTMALTSVQHPSRYGVAKVKGRRIFGFEEKPEPGNEPSRLINAGTYIFEPSIFSYLDDKCLESVFEGLASNSELSGYIYGGNWVDVSQS